MVSRDTVKKNNHTRRASRRPSSNTGCPRSWELSQHSRRGLLESQFPSYKMETLLTFQGWPTDQTEEWVIEHFLNLWSNSSRMSTRTLGDLWYHFRRDCKTKTILILSYSLPFSFSLPPRCALESLTGYPKSESARNCRQKQAWQSSCLLGHQMKETCKNRELGHSCFGKQNFLWKKLLLTCNGFSVIFKWITMLKISQF